MATPYQGPAKRIQLGKEARKAVPLESHADLNIGADRDPVAVLMDQAVSRVPELVPIRYGRMLDSPFTFFRGAAAVMAADLARTPVSGFRTQTCGDAHLSNFGLFASAERTMVFDINDFDETLAGPWEWDVKRLVASLAVAGRINGLNGKQCRRVLTATARGYRTAMRSFARQTALGVWYTQPDIAALLKSRHHVLAHTQVANTKKAVAKARTHDSLHSLDKLSTAVNGGRRIIADPPLVVPIEDLLPGPAAERFSERMHELIRNYSRSLSTDRRHLLEQFRFEHLARKVVGVGSVGTRSWIVLMLGRDDGSPLFLQAKEAQASVLEQYVGTSEHQQHGERVVAGQRLMQASGDIFLGWDRVQGIDGQDRDFYVRQLRDWKGSVVIEDMPPAGLSAYGSVCGWTLARAHARSGDRIAIAAYLGSSERFDEAVADYAEAYAKLNDKDFSVLQRAGRDGRVDVQAGL
jgi:uncharacterized protein (DUF2252 family)